MERALGHGVRESHIHVQVPATTCWATLSKLLPHPNLSSLVKWEHCHPTYRAVIRARWDVKGRCTLVHTGRRYSIKVRLQEAPGTQPGTFQTPSCHAANASLSDSSSNQSLSCKNRALSREAIAHVFGRPPAHQVQPAG